MAERWLKTLKVCAELLFIFLFKCEELLDLQLKGNCQNIYCVYKLSKHRSVIRQNQSNLNTNQVTPANCKLHEHPNQVDIRNRNLTNQPGPLRTPKKSPASVRVTHVLLPDHHCPCLVKSEFHPQQKCCKRSAGRQGGWVTLYMFFFWLVAFNRENIDHASKGL